LVIVWFRQASFIPSFNLDFPGERGVLLVAAGLSLGLAFATRHLDAITQTLPFLLLLLRKPLSLVLVAAGSIPPIALLVLYNLAVTGNPTGGGYTQAAKYDRLGFGATIGGPPGSYGANFDLARGIWNIAYELEHLQIGLFGWPFFLGLAVIAVPFVAGRANRWDWFLVASCLCVIAAYGCYWASGVTGGFPRYWFAIVPWLCILAARGVKTLVCWPSAWLSRSRFQPAAALFPAGFLATMLFFNVNYFLPTNVLYYRNPAGAVAAAVQSAHIHHALIFQHQNTPQDSEYEVIFSQNSPLLNGDIIWAIDRGIKANREAMRTHPGRSYYLMNGQVITRIAAP